MSFLSRLLCGGLLVLCLTAVLPQQPAAAGEPASDLTAAQKERLKERDRLWQEGQKLRAAGKTAEADAAQAALLDLYRGDPAAEDIREMIEPEPAGEKKTED